MVAERCSEQRGVKTSHDRPTQLSLQNSETSGNSSLVSQEILGEQGDQICLQMSSFFLAEVIFMLVNK